MWIGSALAMCIGWRSKPRWTISGWAEWWTSTLTRRASGIGQCGRTWRRISLVFTTHIFVFYFLPVVLLIYYLLPGYRNAFLTIASYIFYAWGAPWIVLLQM